MYSVCVCDFASMVYTIVYECDIPCMYIIHTRIYIYIYIYIYILLMIHYPRDIKMTYYVTYSH